MRTVVETPYQLFTFATFDEASDFAYREIGAGFPVRAIYKEGLEPVGPRQPLLPSPTSLPDDEICSESAIFPGGFRFPKNAADLASAGVCDCKEIW